MEAKDFSHPLFANPIEVLEKLKASRQNLVPTTTSDQEEREPLNLDFLIVRQFLSPEDYIDSSEIHHSSNQNHLLLQFDQPNPRHPITPEPNPVYIRPASPEHQSKNDFYPIFRHYAQTTQSVKDRHSYTVSDPFSKEEINQWGEPLIKCHLLEKITQIKEAYPETEINSVKSKPRDKKTNRIGLSLNTKNGWIRITSDGEKLFITKSNTYHSILDLKLLGIEATKEKLEKILSNDTKRLFDGEQPTPIRRTLLQPIPQTSPQIFRNSK